MKKVRFLTLLWAFLFVWTLAGCWVNVNVNDWDTENPEWKIEATVNYNNKLTDVTYKCMKSEESIWDAYNQYSVEDVQTAIEDTITECTNAKKEIKKLWDWEWDSSLKDGALIIIEKEIDYCTKFKELLPYIEKWDLTEEENSEYEALMTEIKIIDDERKDAHENIENIQEQFAKNYGFRLEWEETTNDEIYEEEVVEDEVE